MWIITLKYANRLQSNLIISVLNSLLMQELFQAAFSSVNSIPTIILIIVVIYWLLVILGAMDLGFLDFDLDADYESDFEMEVQINADVDADADIAGATWFMELLSWFNLGKVPFMVFMSCFSIPFWMLTINVNHYLGVQAWWLALIFLVPIAMVSMIIAKILTLPLVKLFDRLDADGHESLDAVGKKVRVTMRVTHDSLGQVEVKLDGTTNLVAAKSREGVTLEKGASALVIEKSKDRKHYLVAPYEEI